MIISLSLAGFIVLFHYLLLFKLVWGVLSFWDAHAGISLRYSAIDYGHRTVYLQASALRYMVSHGYLSSDLFTYVGEILLQVAI